MHKGVDAHEASNQERSEKDLQHNTELIYGEVIFMYFIPLLEYAKPKAGEVFWDLGCGAGKPLITASLAFPELKVCRGIELLENLVNIAKKIATNQKSLCEAKQIPISPVEVIQGDIRKVDWLDADIIYLSAVLYSEDLLASTSERLVKLKKGARIICLKMLPEKPYLDLYSVIKAK